jgi:hypothetical protein
MLQKTPLHLIAILFEPIDVWGAVVIPCVQEVETFENVVGEWMATVNFA